MNRLSFGSETAGGSFAAERTARMRVRILQADPEHSAGRRVCRIWWMETICEGMDGPAPGHE
jgi:hypothetical protein